MTRGRNLNRKHSAPSQDDRASELALRLAAAKRIELVEECFSPHDLHFAYRDERSELSADDRALCIKALTSGNSDGAK